MSQVHNDNDSGPDNETDLVQVFERTALEQIKALLNSMFDGADDALFSMAEKAENTRNQTLYFDTMRTLRIDRPRIVDGFCDALKANPDGRPRAGGGGDDEPTLDLDAGGSELRLQEMDSLEESIAISNMISRGLQVGGGQYSDLKARVAWLRENHQSDIPAEAYSPRGICVSFQDAMEPVDLDIETRLLIFKLFDIRVIVGLSTLYRRLNELLDEAGVPVIRKAARPGQSHSRPGGQGRSAQNQAEGQPQGGDEHGEGGYGGQDYGGYGGNPGYTGEQFSQFGYATPPGGGAPQPAFPRPPSGISGYGGNPGFQQSFASGVAASQAAGASTVMGPVGLYGIPGPVPQGTAEGGPVPGGVNQGQLLGALGSLQTVARTADPNMVARPGWVGDQLQQYFGVRSPDALDSSMLPDHERVFHLVNSLFSDLLTDPQIFDGAKVLIARMEIPVLKIAMADPEFFRRHSHPARQMLSEVGQLGATIRQKESPVFGKMERIVESLLTDFDQDVKVIERVNQSLRELAYFDPKKPESEGEARRKARNADAVVRAKQVVLDELRTRSRGHKLAEPVKSFLLRAWGPFMGLQYASHGPKSDEWERAIKLLDQLLAACTPIKTEDQYEERTVSQRGMLHDLRVDLMTSGLDSSLTAVRLARLERHLVQTLAEQVRALNAEHEDETSGERPAIDAAVEVTADTEVPEAVEAREAAETGDAQKLHELLEMILQPNTWFQLYTGPEHRHGRWLKVHSFKPEKDQVRFSNHSGQVVESKALNILAEELCDGRSRPIFASDQKFQKLQARLTFMLQNATAEESGTA